MIPERISVGYLYSLEKKKKSSKKPALRPAVKQGDKIKIGKVGQIHDDIVPDAPEKTRGFVTPEGNFLNRPEASKWLKENQPDIYACLSEEGKRELHSEDLIEVGKKEEI